MSEEKTKKEGQQTVAELKKEVAKLRDEKEKLYAEKKEVSKEIVKLINEVKEKRTLRNTLTDSVKNDKEARKKLNQDIREKINTIKVLNTKAPQMKTPKGKPITPKSLQTDIERLQYKVETEGVTFKEEQKLMKIIKEKKAQYDEIKDVGESYTDARSLSKEIDKLKKKADLFHKNVQNNALDSQKKHEEMIDLSNKIDELKEKEKAHHEDFSKVKAQFVELNKKLNELTGNTERTRSSRSSSKDKAESAREMKKRKESLKSKATEINEKIKAGGKLNTEDFMILQQADDKN